MSLGPSKHFFVTHIALMFWIYSKAAQNGQTFFFDFEKRLVFWQPRPRKCPRRRPPRVRDYIIRSLMETSQPPIMSYGGHDRNKATLACLRNLRIFEELQYQFCSKKVGQYGKAAWCKHLGIGAIFDDDVKINEDWMLCKKLAFCQIPRHEREDISIWVHHEASVSSTCSMQAGFVLLSHSSRSWCQWLTLPACQLPWGCCLTTHRASCME